MPTTPTDVVNEALYMIGDRVPLVTGTAPIFDDSSAGKSAAQIYAPTVATVARLFEWDMARSTVALVLSGNVAPFPWALEYRYPANGIQVWQIMPASLADPNNPLPVNWVAANAIVGGIQRKVIQTDLVGALAVYNNNPGPDVWDPGFHEAVVRLLASKFAESVAGKPETAANLLTSFNAFVDVAKSRSD